MKFSPWILLLGSIAFSAGCTGVSSLSEDSARAECGEEGCFETAGMQDAGESDVSTDIGSDGGPLAMLPGANPLCGKLRCNPDDVSATCQPEQRSTDSMKSDHDSEQDEDAGSRRMLPPSPYEGPGAGKGREDAGPRAPEPKDDVFTCQVIRSPIGDRTSTCVPGGHGEDGDPCVSSEDCAPGHTCIAYGDSGGVCRRYCCLDSESCPKDTYCAPRKSHGVDNGGVSESLYVPVCVPVTPCKLMAGQDEQSGCEDGTICAVVRPATGATGCVLPGKAKENQPCDDSSIEVTGRSPCAAGFICSKATNKCVRFCLTGHDETCGDGGFCQGGTTGIPAPYGVCVGSR